MPTYQYECESCRYTFEVVQPITDRKLRKCPRCKKFKLARLIGTGGGLIFKGSGFYETDYKRPKTPPVKDKPPAKPEASSADKKTGSNAFSGKESAE